MRSVKVLITLTRDDGIETTHTLSVSSSIPVAVDDVDDESDIDEAEENERIAAHLDAALNVDRIANWLNDLDELPDADD